MAVVGGVKAVLSKWWLIVGLWVLCVLLTGFLALYQVANAPKYYTARTVLMIPSKHPHSNARQVLVQVPVKGKSAVFRDQLKGSLTVTGFKDTNLVAIEVTLPRPEDAIMAADAAARAYKKAWPSRFGTLKTVNSAYVFPASDHAYLKLGLCLLAGLLSGWIPGTLIAAALAGRQQPSRTPTPELGLAAVTFRQLS